MHLFSALHTFYRQPVCNMQIVWHTGCASPVVAGRRRARPQPAPARRPSERAGIQGDRVVSANLRSWWQPVLAMGAAALLVGAEPAAAEDNVLKIGVLGVMSGPAASWGLVNKYCAETTAQWMNEKGGVDIGGKKYKIEIVSIDDKNDPKLAVSGAERLTRQDGIKYIIGPNVDTTATSIRPVVEKAGAMHFPYAFQKSLYTPPASNAVLGMIASYQAGPIIYRYLKEKKGVKSVAFVARNESDPLNQRTEGVEAAQGLGLTITASKDTYEPGTTDFFPVMTKVVKTK